MLQLNMQPPEKAHYHPDGLLDVVDVFYTLQGEGPFAGMPAVFVRLAGCQLQCPECDTDYTTNRRTLTPGELASQVHPFFDTVPPARNGWSPRDGRLVVLTGGEPFRQNLGPFVRELLGHGYRVQVETNGAFCPDDFPWAGDVTVVCSPKTGRVHDLLRPYVKHLKYVVEVGKVDPANGLPTSTLGNTSQVQWPWPGFRGTVWVQPADQQNEECNRLNLEQAVDSCLRFGHRLSVQIHKQAGLK